MKLLQVSLALVIACGVILAGCGKQPLDDPETPTTTSITTTTAAEGVTFTSDTVSTTASTTEAGKVTENNGDNVMEDIFGDSSTTLAPIQGSTSRSVSTTTTASQTAVTTSTSKATATTTDDGYSKRY